LPVIQPEHAYDCFGGIDTEITPACQLNWRIYGLRIPSIWLQMLIIFIKSPDLVNIFIKDSELQALRFTAAILAVPGCVADRFYVRR
jgi:hypothetical protein